MIPDLNQVCIYIKPGSTDMRKQINGLAMYVSQEMKKQSMNGDIYLFCGSGRTLLKAIYWDRNGFCMWQKRLERDRFPWPRTEEEAKKITGEELKMLLRGIDFFKAHQTLHFSAVS